MDTPLRLLHLLSLLRHGRAWSAGELADALDVTTRTVRRDIARLRAWDYPLAATLGPGGGYTLSPDAVLPSLPLDADQAAAMLLSLRRKVPTATDASTLDAALHDALPAPLRSSTAALFSHASEVWLGRMIGAPPVTEDPMTLAVLARACRNRRQVSCAVDGGEPAVIEPHHLVRALDRWYLLAHHPASAERQVLPVHRLRDITVSNVPAGTAPPAADAREQVTEHVRRRVQRVTATVRVHAPAAVVSRWVEPAWGTLHPEPDGSTTVVCGADTYDAVARWLLLVGADVTVVSPPQLRDAFARVAATATRAARAAGAADPP